MFFKKEKMKENIVNIIYKKSRVVRYFEFIIGTFLVAFAFNLLVLPNKLVYGISGIGVIFNYLFGSDPAIIILIGSLLLLILSFITLGFEKSKNSIIGSLLYPVLVKITEPLITNLDFLNFNQADPILLTIFAAVLTGFGLGLIFKTGFTTGGTDILNQICAKYFKKSIGDSMFFTDGLIIISAIFVPSIGATYVMHSLVFLYIVSIMTDKVILGISKSKAFYIITSKPVEVKQYILDNISHGVTIIDARGGYSNEKEKMLMCVIPTSMYFKLKEGLVFIDDESFFVVTDAYETVGGSVNKNL